MHNTEFAEGLSYASVEGSLRIFLLLLEWQWLSLSQWINQAHNRSLPPFVVMVCSLSSFSPFLMFLYGPASQNSPLCNSRVNSRGSWPPWPPSRLVELVSSFRHLADGEGVEGRVEPFPYMGDGRTCLRAATSWFKRYVSMLGGWPAASVGAASQWWSNELMMVYCKLMMVKCSLMMVKC